MVEFWMIIVLLCLLIATVIALIAARRQYRATLLEREAWQQAQESRQRTWEVRQGKHVVDTEKKFADQFKNLREEWRRWREQAELRQKDWQMRAHIERELARLPHVDHLEVSRNAHAQRQIPAHWQPPMLYQAALDKQDLSYRYMARADLREARLVEADLHMSDLTGASMTNANLECADLTGTNLCGADLRGVNLCGANFLVADLHSTLLHGAMLMGARNLSPQQLQSAIYDSTTLIDTPEEITQPRIPAISLATMPDTPQPELLHADSLPDMIETVLNLPEATDDEAAMTPSEATLDELPDTPPPAPDTEEAFDKTQFEPTMPEPQPFFFAPIELAQLEPAQSETEVETSPVLIIEPEMVIAQTLPEETEHVDAQEQAEDEQHNNAKILHLPARTGQTDPQPVPDPLSASASHNGRKDQRGPGQKKKMLLESKKATNRRANV